MLRETAENFEDAEVVRRTCQKLFRPFDDDVDDVDDVDDNMSSELQNFLQEFAGNLSKVLKNLLADAELV